MSAVHEQFHRQCFDTVITHHHPPFSEWCLHSMPCFLHECCVLQQRTSQNVKSSRCWWGEATTLTQSRLGKRLRARTRYLGNVCNVLCAIFLHCSYALPKWGWGTAFVGSSLLEKKLPPQRRTCVACPFRRKSACVVQWPVLVPDFITLLHDFGYDAPNDRTERELLLLTVISSPTDWADIECCPICYLLCNPQNKLWFFCLGSVHQ